MSELKERSIGNRNLNHAMIMKCRECGMLAFWFYIEVICSTCGPAPIRWTGGVLEPSEDMGT